VNRDFTLSYPNTFWLTDITVHPTSEGGVSSRKIKNLLSDRIVGYSIQDPITAHIVVRAMRIAVARRQTHGTLIIHSGRGGQFRSRALRAVLTANGRTGSMGSVA
jgi:transposase InsO family protein